MAILPLPHPTPAGVVGAACAEIAPLHEVLWSGRPEEELVAGVEELQRLKATVAALEAELLAELDVRGTAKTSLAWGSTVDWFTHLAGTTRRQGKRTVVHARLLVSDRGATLDALREGTVSPDQAGVVVDAVERLPSSAAVRGRGEAFLLAEATRLNASDLHKAGRHLARVVDPDGEDHKAEKDLDREDRAAHLDRFLSIAEDGCGGVRVKGRGSAEDGATLRAALLPLTEPEPTIDPATCEKLPDPRDHGARLWDALVVLAQHALDADLPPASHGARPRVAVTIDLGGLADAAVGHPGGGTGHVGVTEDGVELPASVVRRLACDADLVPVVLGTHAAVLDVGRTHRLVTPPIWTALVARDRHCAFPGCTRPPIMCHAHHMHHWADGGTTSLDNLVLLCGHHHRTIHGSPWQVRLATHDRRPEFLPPAKPGRPPPEWMRHRPRQE